MFRAPVLVILTLATLTASAQTAPPELPTFSSALPKFTSESLAKPESPAGNDFAPVINPERPDRGFAWKPAINQSMRFLIIEHGIMLANDKWTRYSVTHGPFFRDWTRAVAGTFKTWDDGDPFLDNYIGHPIQGALTGYIQVQNDPRGQAEEISWKRSYWMSRLKATAWSAAYSTQFEIGPVSEASIANLGGFEYRNCPTCKMTHGAGWVDLVMTPAGGLGWMLAEDAADRFLIKRAEKDGKPGGWAKFLRCALNPARSAANMLARKKPWYRPRDESLQPALVAVPGSFESQQVGDATGGRQH